MRHKKNFLRGPLNYLPVSMQNFRQIEKCIAGQKMLFFFLQIGPGKLYKSYFMQKSAAPSCSCPGRRDQLISSTSQLDMKGDSAKKEGPAHPFLPQRISSSPGMDCKRTERQKCQEGIVSASELHGTALLVQALGRVPKSMDPSRGRGRDKPYVRERK